jgi:hypothetical protein
MSLRPVSIETEGKYVPETPTPKRIPMPFPYAPKKHSKPQPDILPEQELAPDDEMEPEPIVPLSFREDAWRDAMIDADVKRAIKNVSARVEYFLSTPLHSESIVDLYIDAANFHGEFMQDVGVISPEELSSLKAKLAEYRQLPLPSDDDFMEDATTSHTLDTSASGALGLLENRKRYDDRVQSASTIENYREALKYFVDGIYVAKIVAPVAAVVSTAVGTTAAVFSPTVNRMFRFIGVPTGLTRYGRELQAIEDQRMNDARATDAWSTVYRILYGRNENYTPEDLGRMGRHRANQLTPGINVESEADRNERMLNETGSMQAVAAVTAVLAISGLAIWKVLEYAHMNKLAADADVAIENNKNLLQQAMPFIELQSKWCRRWGINIEPSLRVLKEMKEQVFGLPSRTTNEKRNKADGVTRLVDQFVTFLNAAKNAGWTDELDENKDRFEEYERIVKKVGKKLYTLEEFEGIISNSNQPGVPQADALYGDYKDVFDQLRCKLGTPQQTDDLLEETIAALNALDTILSRDTFDRIQGNLVLWKERRRIFLRRGRQPPCPVIEASMVDSVVDAYLAKRMAAQASVSGALSFVPR